MCFSQQNDWYLYVELTEVLFKEKTRKFNDALIF